MPARLTVAALAAALVAAPAPAQAPSPARVQAMLREVAQVIASDCGGGSSARAGTAFVWPDAERMVTARHVVAGCGRLRVQFPGGASFTARPERELVRHDLVLLKLPQSSGRQPLALAAADPPVHSQVAAVGYALGAPTPDDKLLTVTAANAGGRAVLRHILSDRFAREIEQSGALSLDTAILRLDGNLLSGHSGAPVLAADGRVVAVGSGGLQNGAGGVVWAVRATYLPLLARQQEIASDSRLQRPTGLLFADQAPQAEVRTQQCGPFALSVARTESLEQLAQGTDDPAGLRTLLETIGPSLAEAGQDMFDVWVDRQSGAAIPLPRGTQLKAGPAGCIAVLSGTVGFNIVTHRTTAATAEGRAQEVQMVSSALEQVLNISMPGLMMDPQFTYRAPLERPDGFVARRKGAARAFPTAPGTMQSDYVFLTHLMRGDSYVGISAVRANMQLPIAEVQACAPNPRAPGCGDFRRAFRDWALAAAAVHLTTIPPI